MDQTRIYRGAAKEKQLSPNLSAQAFAIMYNVSDESGGLTADSVFAVLQYTWQFVLWIT